MNFHAVKRGLFFMVVCETGQEKTGQLECSKILVSNPVIVAVF